MVCGYPNTQNLFVPLRTLQFFFVPEPDAAATYQERHVYLKNPSVGCWDDLIVLDFKRRDIFYRSAKVN